MPLILGQLIYTSFAKVGFKALASPNIPTKVQQAFIEQIVHQYWNSYDSPPVEYRAAYIHEVSLEHNLFGWLYNDGVDDLGRSHVPYFICYYLPGTLDSILLENIFTCLQKGPLEFIDRHNAPDNLAPISVSDLWSYESAKIGVEISSEQRDRYHIELQQKQLLSIFVQVDSQNLKTEQNLVSFPPQQLHFQASQHNLLKQSHERKDLSSCASVVDLSFNPKKLNKALPSFNIQLPQQITSVDADKSQSYTAKIALLIGVTESGFGFDFFPNAQKDVEAIQRVLQNPEIGSFDEVKTLLNPNKQMMEEAIETLFINCQKDDLVLIYFSGQATKSDNKKLYLHTSTTRKNAQNKLIKSSAVLANFIQDVMNSLPCRHQILILEAAWLDETSPEVLLEQNNISLEIKEQFSGEGRVIITASTSAGYLLEQHEYNISAYTRYFVEGMETGAAALDSESVISIKNLHDYALKRIQQAIPTKQPGIYNLENHQELILANVAIDEAKRKYRHEVENYVNNGDISLIGRSILSCVRENLGLLPEEASAIEAQVLEPFQEYQIKLQCYTQEFVKTIYLQTTISDEARQQLTSLRILLGIKAEDAVKIESQCLDRIKSPLSSDNYLALNGTTAGHNKNSEQSQLVAKPTINNQVVTLKNKNFQLTRIAITIILGAIYIFLQLQDSQNLKAIETSIQEKNYKKCLALTPSIGAISIYYLSAQQLHNKCVIASHLKTIWSIAFTPDEKIFVTANSDNTIKLWDAENQRLLKTLSGHSDILWSVAISPNGRILASGSGDKTIKLWNLDTGKLIRTLYGHKSKVRSLAISPSGQILASSSYDRTIKLWNLRTGQLIRTLLGHTKEVTSLAISPNGRILASGSYDRTIKLWDLYTGKLINTFSGHTDNITSIAISPDGQTLASGSYDQTIKLWNLRNGELIHTFSGHTDWINAIAISPNGQLLASGAEDHLVIVWDLQTGKLLQKISEHSEDVYSIAISPNSRSVISGDKAGLIKVHPLAARTAP